MKKVLVIGNGSSCLKKKIGDQIDNEFDIVIRLNDYVINGYEQYIGTREDIWSTGAGIATNPRNVSNFKDVWISYPYVCNNMMSQLATRVTLGGCYTIMGVNFLRNVDTQLEMPSNFYCSSGVYAINFACKKFNVPIYILGFDLFSDCGDGSKVNHYYGEHTTEPVGQHKIELERKWLHQQINNGMIIKL